MGGKLDIQTPRGGRISLQGDAVAPLRVEASDYRSLRDLALLGRKLLPDGGPIRWLRSQNVTGQEVVVYVKDQELLRWAPGKSMRIKRWTRALRFLIGR